MENFNDIKIGNIVIAYDEYSHDYIEHRIKIESVEHDEAYITEENPEGIVYYGIDLDREDDDDDFISVVTEGNFCGIEKFELWFGCLGNGITVCNKAVEENGDYKIVAHISEGGNIKFYVPETYIPRVEMASIIVIAAKQAAKFQIEFEKLPNINQYTIILDRVPHQKFMEYIKDRKPMAEKLPVMREYYYTIA